jgi:hypothetical protein
MFVIIVMADDVRLLTPPTLGRGLQLELQLELRQFPSSGPTMSPISPLATLQPAVEPDSAAAPSQRVAAYLAEQGHATHAWDSDDHVEGKDFVPLDDVVWKQ